MRKIKNLIIGGLLIISIILALLSACALDSESMIPSVICVGSLAYILLFLAANSRG